MDAFEKKAYGWVACVGPVVARILIGGVFFLSGVSKLFDVSGTVGYITSAGLPFADILVWFAIAIEIVGGLSVILGYKIRYGADMLAFFILVATIFFHNFWAFEGAERGMQMIAFNKNLAIFGGLLYMMAFGAGPYSLDNKKKKEPPMQEEQMAG